MMLILNCGSLLVSNTDKALLMQTPGNMLTSDIIGVYVYEMGLTKAQFSYTTAIGLFINVINFVMIVTVNWIARRFGETSLF
jgi:putative aldouronate transport system permease protein